MLSDGQIRHALRWRGLSISGFNELFLQPASYDVHLHPDLLVLRGEGFIDPKVDTADRFESISMTDDGWVLQAGDFALASTLERVDMGFEIMGQVEGKSSLGRLGLMVHSTAGYIDPGFAGQITLELSCSQRYGIKLYPAMPIAQIAFMSCPSVTKVYRGKYIGQRGPTPSRFHMNWDEETNSWVA